MPLPIKSGFGGKLGSQLDDILEELRALRPVSGAGTMVSRTSLGSTRTVQPTASQDSRVIEVTLINDYWPVLICQDSSGNQYNVYSPIGLEWNAGSGAQGILRPKRDSGFDLAGFNWHDTGDLTHGESNRYRRDFPISGGFDVVREALTPGFVQNESLLYILPLKNTVDASAGITGSTYTCTHIDLNLAGRQWIPFRSTDRFDAPMIDTDAAP